LILIDILNKLLENPTLLEKQPSAWVLLHFNDENKAYFEKLNESLKNYTINPKIIIKITNKNFN
jgi:predicted urease superfamily metal-dependent hydrolase